MVHQILIKTKVVKVSIWRSGTFFDQGPKYWLYYIYHKMMAIIKLTKLTSNLGPFKQVKQSGTDVYSEKIQC